MTVIDTRPNTLDIKSYGGDDLPLRVNVNGADYSGAVWKAQVKLDHDSAADAEFQITVDALGADLVLLADDVAALMELGTPELPVYGAKPTSIVRKYLGVWDLQVDDNGSVKTLIQGLFEVYADVTRV